jgi:hypothetical protein
LNGIETDKALKEFVKNIMLMGIFALPSPIPPLPDCNLPFSKKRDCISFGNKAGFWQ